MGRSRSRSRSSRKQKKHKKSDSHHEKHHHHRDKQHDKKKAPDDFDSRDWRKDRIDPTANGMEVLDIIKREREEDEAKLEQWKKKVGYTGVKVKAPLNVYEEVALPLTASRYSKRT